MSITPKFIKKINRDEGNPNDYISGVDYQVDTIANVISVLDRTQKLILNYTLTGEFIDKQELSFWAMAFYKDSSNTIVYSAHEGNENEGRLTFYSSDSLEPLSNALPINPKMAPFMTFIDIYLFDEYVRNVSHWLVKNNNPQ